MKIFMIALLMGEYNKHICQIKSVENVIAVKCGVVKKIKVFN